MTSKLAGHLPLQDMIANVLDDTRSKLAAAEEKEEKKESKEHEAKEKKMPPAAKAKEEAKEGEKEKDSSVIDFNNPDEVEKLASALDEMADDLFKMAGDSIENGGESRQGGEQLPTMGVVPGKQPYTGAKATPKRQVPTSTGMKAAKDNPGAATAVPTDDERAPGGTGAEYPAKGVLKTGSVQRLENALEKMAETEQERAERYGKVGAGVGMAAGAVKAFRNRKLLGALAKRHPGATAAGAALGTGWNAALGYGAGRLTHRVAHGPTHEGKKVKESSVDFIMNKIAEFHGGGETLDSANNARGPGKMQPGRELIQNKDQIKNVTKREAKAPVKKPLSEVLAEPALTSKTDNTVQQNLPSVAQKGGVKIAAVKEYLRKVAAEGCICGNQGECDYCKMHKTLEKKRADRKVKESIGMPPTGPSMVPPGTTSMPMT